MNTVKIETLVTALKHLNWNEKNFKNTSLKVFEKYFEDYKKTYELVFPSSEEFFDYDEKVAKILHTVSKLEKIDVDTILNRAIPDTLQFRIVSNETEEGRIRLAWLSRIAEGAYKLLLHAINSEIAPSPVRGNSILNKASVLMNNIDFAPTGIGSFVVNIEVKRDIEGKQLDIDEMISGDLERRALERVIDGIEYVKSDLSISTKVKEAYKTGYNYDMCKGMENILSGQGEYEIEAVITLRDTEKNSERQKKVVLTEKDKEYFTKLAEKYKESTSSVDMEVQVKIDKLNRKSKKFAENDTRTNVIRAGRYSREKKGMEYFWASLSEDDYYQACDAHRDNKHVIIKGEILVNDYKSTFYFDTVKSLTVLDD